MHNFSQLALLNRDRFTDRTIRQEEYILVVKYTHPMHGTSYTEHWLEVRIPLGTELSQYKVYRIKHLHASLTQGSRGNSGGSERFTYVPKTKIQVLKTTGWKVEAIGSCLPYKWRKTRGFYIVRDIVERT